MIRNPRWVPCWLASSAILLSVVAGSFVEARAQCFSEWSPPGLQDLDEFGEDVAVEGDWIAVGAPDHLRAGAVFMYRKTLSGPVLIQSLFASDGHILDNFGISVSMDGGRLAVGNGARNGGKVYIFELRGGNQWMESAIMVVGPSRGPYGASHVAMKGAIVLAGAHQDDTLKDNAGSTLVFEEQGGQWSHQTTLDPSDSRESDLFGVGVAFDGRTAVIGAPGGQAVYAFDYDGVQWREALIHRADTTGNYGSSVAVEGDLFAAGAGQAGGHTGFIDIFERSGETWQLRESLTESRQDEFGTGVAMSGRLLAVGASRADPSGHVYVYEDVGDRYQLIEWFNPTSLEEFAFLGTSLAMDTDELVMGAPGSLVNHQPGSFVHMSISELLDREDGSVVRGSPLQTDSRLGDSVDIHGDLTVVGAPHHDFVGNDSGLVHAIRDNVARLSPHDAAMDQRFGSSVACWQERVLVGAPGHALGGLDAGAAYTFLRDGAIFPEEQRLLADDAEAGDLFGSASDLGGDDAVIGAPGLGGAGQGAVYVFGLSGGTWSQVQKIDSGSGQDDGFGAAVSLDGDVLAVGAPHDADSGPDAGAVHMFERQGGVWVPVGKLYAPSFEDGALFGTSVSVDGGQVVVGAPLHDDPTSATVDVGLAIVYRFDGTTWQFEAELGSSEGKSGDAFGTSVSTSGSQAMVGAPGADRVLPDRGRVSLFRKVGSQWVEQIADPCIAEIQSSRWGESVALEDGRGMMGGPFAMRGVERSGSAYLQEFSALSLEARPGSSVAEGETIALETRGGLPGSSVSLWVVAVEDNPILVPVVFGLFDGESRFTLEAEMPIGTPNLRIQLQSFGFHPDGGPAMSNTEFVWVR